MSKYDLARMEHYTRAFAASVSRDGRTGYASRVAEEALEYFDRQFPRPVSDDD